MKCMNIPEIGTRFALANDWSFNLFNESRNESLVKIFSFPICLPWHASVDHAAAAEAGWLISDEENKYDRLFYKKIILPASTVLKIDRIYIRKGLSGFSSISFFIERKSVYPDFSEDCMRIHTGKGKCRFWAKLNDVNTITYI